MSDHWMVTREWMQEVMGEQFPDDEDDFKQALQNGVVLCNLANRIRPGSITTIREGKVFFERENVGSFIKFAREIGCPEMDLFVVSDLFELKDFKKVCICVLSVARYSAGVDEFEGPYFIAGKLTFNREGDIDNVVINAAEGLPECPTCNKPVLFTERLTALGQTFHKLCFKCTCCGVIIGGGNYCDHDELAYCTKCYNQFFQPKYYGTNQSDTHNYEDKAGFVPKQKEKAKSNIPLSREAEAISNKFRSVNPECYTCGKAVYPVELLTFHSKTYHKNCFVCTDCHRIISQGTQLERDEQPYCNACYARLPVMKLAPRVK